MYPNPQDVLPLPPHPDVEQYRKRAKDLARSFRSDEPEALDQWALRWVRDVARLTADDSPGRARDQQRRAQQIADFARDRLTRADGALSEAQFVVARAHGFLSWPRLMSHLEALPATETEVSTYERAADAIVSGDIETLGALLKADPTLVSKRSTREHRATLLHYVAANGVENYRQKTPPNIVAIARLLLDAGAAVDADADVYGGGATTLGLVVTSAHPRAAGVQNELTDLLIDRGARVDPNTPHGCLMNGCPEAAAHLVSRGVVKANLEAAAGVGRLDLVRDLWPTRVPGEEIPALRMATWYGRTDVVRFLLDEGTDVAARDEKDGDTALHIACYEGHPEIVAELLRRGADVHAIDAVYRTPPITWALHAMLVENRKRSDAYRDVLRQLLDAGAVVRTDWIDDDRLREDAELWPRLSAAATLPADS